MNVWKARPRAVTAGLLIAVLTVSGAAVAASDGPIPAAVRQLLDCRKITAEPERLACYDKAVDALSASLNKGEVVAVDKEQMRDVRRQAFGFHVPSIALFEKGDKPEEVDRITATIADVRRHSDGRWILTLEDGAVWDQVDDEPVQRAPHKGSKVEIRKAALSTFFINIDGQRAIRAKRLQ